MNQREELKGIITDPEKHRVKKVMCQKLRKFPWMRKKISSNTILIGFYLEFL